MRRRKGRRGSRDVAYKRDIQSYSIYPRIRVEREERPVKPGGIYRVKILDIDEKGRGMGRIADIKIHVPQATVGDEVKVKILEVRGGDAYGEIVEWIGRVK